MSKLSEQKALEEFPSTDKDPNGIFVQVRREDYANGYDKAMQDVKEFIYEYFYVHPHDCHLVMYESDTPLENDLDDFWEQLEKYLDGK